MLNWMELWGELEAELVEGVFGDSVSIRQRRRTLDRCLLDASMTAEQVGRFVDLDLDLDLEDPLVRAVIRQRADYGRSDALTQAVEHASDAISVRSPALKDLPPILSRSNTPEWSWHVAERLVEDGVSQSSGGRLKASLWAGAGETVDADGELADIVRDSWKALLDLLPALTRSMLEHTAAIGWLDIEKAEGGLASATLPDLPGVILLPKDIVRSGTLVAEGLLHEAAHCKFFDLVMTQDILGSASHGLPIVIPWVTPASLQQAAWPVDQVVAAAHAYTHLAALGARGLLEGVAAEAVPIWSELYDRSLGRGSFLLKALQGTPHWALGVAGRQLCGWLDALLRRMETLVEWRRFGQMVGDTRLQREVGIVLSPPLPDGSLVVVRSGGLDAVWLEAPYCAILEAIDSTEFKEIVLKVQELMGVVGARAQIEAMMIVQRLLIGGLVRREVF